MVMINDDDDDDDDDDGGDNDVKLLCRVQKRV